MTKKKLIFTIIVTFMLSGMLGWAGGQKATEKVPSGGATQIKFVGMEYYEWSNEWYEDTARKFEAKNPDIKVNVETVPWDLGFDRYVVWIKGGLPPEVGLGGAKWTLEFKSMDAVEPLDSYMSPAFKNNIIGSQLDPLIFDGKYYALPIGAGSRSFYYNPEIFKKAGLSGPPKTWDDLEMVCGKIKANQPDVFPLSYNAGDHEAIWNARHFELSAGADMIDAQRNWKVDTPENVEALSFIGSLAKQGYIQPGSTGATREEVQQLFIQGKAAMITENQELINRIKEINPGLSYDISPFPRKRASGDQVIIDTIFLFKGTKNKEAAWKYIEFFLSYDIHLDMVKGVGGYAATKDVAEVWPKGEMNEKFKKIMAEAKMYPIAIGWEVAQEEYVKAVQATILGTQTPEEALKIAQKRIEERVQK